MLRAKSSRRNFVWERSSVLIHVPSHSSLNSSLIELVGVKLLPSTVSTEPQWKNIRTSEKCHQVKEAGAFFCLRASRHRNMFFCFPIFLPIEKAYSTKQRYQCNSLSWKLLLQLIDNSATKGFFFLTDNWVTLVFHTLARCKLRATVELFQPFFNVLRLSHWQAQAGPVQMQHDNESWHACQRVYLTNTYNLNSYDSWIRAWANVFTRKKTVPQRCSSIVFDFFDLSSSNLVQESSVDLWDKLNKVRGLPHNALHFPSSITRKKIKKSKDDRRATCVNTAAHARAPLSYEFRVYGFGRHARLRACQG